MDAHGPSDLFTAEFRGTPADSAASRWEEIFVHEASTVYALLLGLSRIPLARRLIGPVPVLREAASLEEREAALARLRENRVYRRVERFRRRARRRSPRRLGAAQPVAPAEPSPAAPGPVAQDPPTTLGPATSRRVDEAIELLRTIPFAEIQRRGWHFQPNHYYWPLNDLEFLAANRELWSRRLPSAIRWDLDRQVALIRDVVAYRDEMADIPHQPRPGVTEFTWGNATFDRADAIVYYGLVRSRRPRRVVEVGAGWSSLLLARALERNERACEVTLIEPGPDFNTYWAPTLPSQWRVHEALLQHVDLIHFDALEAGDVCFFDGSHAVRTAGDVNWFVFEVLPRLRPGVLVHFHDVFFPDDYPERFIFEEGLSWNEQYLLQALLMHSAGYEVLAANHLLYVERRDEIDRLHGEDGSSIWLEKRAEAIRGRAP